MSPALRDTILAAIALGFVLGVLVAIIAYSTGVLP